MQQKTYFTRRHGSDQWEIRSLDGEWILSVDRSVNPKTGRRYCSRRGAKRYAAASSAPNMRSLFYWLLLAVLAFGFGAAFALAV